jgi:hypothetical protein
VTDEADMDALDAIADSGPDQADFFGVGPSSCLRAGPSHSRA